MIRVIIADDSLLLIESLKIIVEKDNDMKVVGTAKDGKEAFSLCNFLMPDVVLMDIAMPVCDGIEGTKLIKADHKSIKIIILTTFEDEEKISKALKNGADGYILKDISPEALRTAIRSAMAGLPIIHQKILDTMIKQFDDYYSEEDTYDTNIIMEFNALSEKEKNIVKLIVQGKNSKEIAASIYLSEGRVKNIVTEIIAKLGFKDRTQLAVFVVKNRLV